MITTIYLSYSKKSMLISLEILFNLRYKIYYDVDRTITTSLLT